MVPLHVSSAARVSYSLHFALKPAVLQRPLLAHKGPTAYCIAFRPSICFHSFASCSLSSYSFGFNN